MRYIHLFVCHFEDFVYFGSMISLTKPIFKKQNPKSLKRAGNVNIKNYQK